MAGIGSVGHGKLLAAPHRNHLCIHPLAITSPPQWERGIGMPSRILNGFNLELHPPRGSSEQLWLTTDPIGKGNLQALDILGEKKIHLTSPRRNKITSLISQNSDFLSGNDGSLYGKFICKYQNWAIKWKDPCHGMKS